jgi:hypothetical protein
VKICGELISKIKIMTTLQEEKEQYVQNQANKILEYMQENHLFTDTLSTCDAPNWDRILHRMMPQITSKLNELGINSSSQVKFGVTDWTFTVK